MADMTDAVSRGADGAEKFNAAKDDHEHAHRNRDGQREQKHLAMRIEKTAHRNVNHTRADATNKEVRVELARAPHVFEVGAKHREVQEVKENVQDAGVQ